jgi:hypothetical protein
MAVLMFIDGVLRNHKKAPIPNGMMLYRSLNENNRVLLISSDKDKDDTWLKQHKIFKFDDIVGVDIPAIGDDPEYRQVEYVRGLGPVEYVVTSSPELAQKLLVAGVTAIVFLNPVYVDERFRPDSRKGVRSWAEVSQEIEKQQEAYNEDPRVAD